MKRTNWQYLVDTLLFISVIGLVVIGGLLGFVIPVGPSASESTKYFLGLHRHGWGDIHLYLGITFAAMTVLHLILGWGWIKGKTRRIFGERWKAVLISAPVVAVAVLVAFWALLMAYPNPYEDYGKPGGAGPGRASLAVHETPSADGEILITGQVTLAELERQTGVSAGEMAQALDLPPGVPSDESLGRLKKRYPFDLEQARGAVTELSERREEFHPPPRGVERGEMPMEVAAHEEPKLTRGRGAEDPFGVLITGQMSLYDVERQTGASAQAIARRLGIPPGVPLNERLGRLRRTYVFTVQDVRDAVSDLMIRD